MVVNDTHAIMTSVEFADLQSPPICKAPQPGFRWRQFRWGEWELAEYVPLSGMRLGVHKRAILVVG